VEYRLRRFEPNETEADFLRAYAGTLSFEIGAHGKNRCSLFGTPLQGLESHVAHDEESRTVTVRFTPAE
jgi:hypothetical protein